MKKKKNIPSPAPKPSPDLFVAASHFWSVLVADLERASSTAQKLAEAIVAMKRSDREMYFSEDAGDPREVAREAKHLAWVLGVFVGVFEATMPRGARTLE